VKLHILRSDGGPTSPFGAETVPVSLLMSGPAGGVTGVLWIARQADVENPLTFGMRGSSADACLVKDGVALMRRETAVGGITVRASSVGVRSVGAGGASAAQAGAQSTYVDGAHRTVPECDRAKLVAGNVMEGPAIVMQLDSTTVLLPDHDGEIDAIGNILIRPRRAA